MVSLAPPPPSQYRAEIARRAAPVRRIAARVGRRARVRGGWLRVLRNAVIAFYSQAGTRMAAALSYYSIFAAGPTLLLTLWLGTLLAGEEVTRDTVAQIVSRVLPPNAEQTTMLATRVVRHSTPAAGLAVVAGVVSLFAFTRALTQSLNVTMNAAGREPLHRTVVVAPLLLLAVVGLLWGAWALELAVDVAEVAAGTTEDAPLGRALGGLVPWVLATVYFAIILTVVPRVRLSRIEVLLPAAIGAGLWEGARQAFGWLVGAESLYLQVFGPLGGVVALLGWVYLSSAILVLTGQIAWAYAMERRGRGRDAAEAPRAAGLDGRIEPLEADNVVNEGTRC